MDTSLQTESLLHTGTTFFPEGVGPFASSMDSLFYFIFWGSVIIFVPLILVSIYFLIAYRRKRENQLATKQMTHSTFLELAWTVPPTILVLIVFVWGFKGFLHMSVAPLNSQEIHVSGKKWFWEFSYPNGNKGIGELVVPVDTPVTLLMTSEDVIHSFFVPNFRIKRDVLPNRYTKLWFEADKVGNYQVFCTEYCGDGHSAMLAVVRVLSAEDYEDWLAEANSGDDLPLDKLGEKLYTSKACATCHSTDGTSRVGPTWKSLFGSKKAFVGGGTATVDENYIHESIVNPGAKVVAGFDNVMPTYAGSLNDREISALIAYIKTLQ
jgi:cytochrome c oxidase subunit II